MKKHILLLLTFLAGFGFAQAQTGSAVRLESNGKVSNTIIYDNRGLRPVPTGVLIEHSASDSALIGSGNASSLITTPFSGNYRINSSSPAYNTGRLSDLRVGDALDLGYHPRVDCNALDMGAYEFEVVTTEIFLQPQAVHVCEGDRPVLATDAHGTDVTYQWQRNGKDISGAVSKTYTVSGALSDTGTYRVIAIGNCCNDTSIEVKVAIDAKPMVLAMNDTTIVSGSNITLQILDSIGEVYWLEGDYTTPVSDVTLLNITQTREYIAFARNGVCPDAVQDPVIITVEGMSCLIKAKADTMLCEGDSYRLIPDGVNSTAAAKKWLIEGTLIEYVNGTVVGPKEDTRYVVIGETSDGSTCSDTLTIRIHQVDLQAMADKTVCDSTPITLTSTPWEDVQWYDIAGKPLGTGNINVMPPQNTATKYIAELNDGTCTARDTVNVLINPPVLEIFAEDTIICAGEPVHLTTNVDVELVTWIDQTTQTELPEDPTVYPTTSGIYRAWIYDELCGDVFVEVAVEVRERPNFSADLTKTEVCKDEEFVLTAVPNATYWTLLDGTILNSTTIKADHSETYIGVFVDADHVCADTDTVTDTVHVDVETLALSARPDTTITQGNSVELWSIPDASQWINLETGSTLTTQTVTPLDTTAYVAILQSQRCKVEDTVYIYVQESDTFDLLVIPDIRCYEDSGWVFASVIGETGPYTFLWSNGSTDSIITGLPPGTTYTVTVTDRNGKTKTDSAQILDGSPLLITDTTMIDANNEACDNGSINIEVSGGVPNNDGSYSYTYRWNDGYTSDETGSRFNLESGIYTITVTDGRGCELETEVTLICTHRRVMPTIFITPNNDAKNDFVKISHIEYYPRNRVVILNAYGDEVCNLRNYNNTTVKWDGRNQKGEILPDGVYYYVVEAEGVDPMAGWIYMKLSKRNL